ncbi:hypothetical protein ON010_g12345 [Phytophthora cinnamomi]|nr:hypothetical protein ON010_g12345 [Phytophthora cinnamomi]
MPIITQLRAEVDRLNQAMTNRTRVPSNLPKFTGKPGENVREWLFQIVNACRINNIPIEDTSTRLPGIEGVGDGEACLRLVPALVIDDSKRGAHVGPHLPSGEHERARPSAVLRERSQASHTPLRQARELSDSERRDGLDCQFSSAEQPQAHGKPFRGKPFRGKGRFKPRVEPKRPEGRICFHCKKPCHIKANCFLWKKEQEKPENGQPPSRYPKHVAGLWSHHDLRFETLDHGASPPDDEVQRHEHSREAWRQPNRGSGAGSFAFEDPRVGSGRGVPVWRCRLRDTR